MKDDPRSLFIHAVCVEVFRPFFQCGQASQCFELG